MATAVRKTVSTALFAATAAFMPIGAALTAPITPTASAAEMCMPTYRPVYMHMREVPPPAPGAQWTFGGEHANVDYCKDLSYAELITEGGTASSPKQLMLFHKGIYIGIGTVHNAAYQRIVRADDSSVTVQYGVPGSSSADVVWKNFVTYRWVGDHVRMEGSVPPEMVR